MGGFFEQTSGNGPGKNIDKDIRGTAEKVNPSKTDTPLTTDALITKLTQIRKSNYKITLVNEITEADLPKVQELILQLGNKILKANIPQQKKLADAQMHLNEVIDSLCKNGSKFGVVSFAAQLLQYYTVITDKDFSSDASFQEFHQFVNDNVDKFGTVSKNLLITEYYLIKAYNHLCIYADSATGKIAPIQNMANKTDLILEQLNLIKTQIDEWMIAAPCNTFVCYLNFSLHYSCAKAFELYYHLEAKTLSGEDQYRLAMIQGNFLTTALENLNKIDEIKTGAQDRNISFLGGSEYSLGQNVLVKMPIEDIDLLKSHVSGLLK